MLCCAFSVKAQYKVDRLLTSGRIALHYEDYVLAIQYFNQAISQKPYLWEPWELRAIAKYYLEDWQGASTDASQAILLNPYVTTLYDLRGIANIRLERFSEAYDDYTKAIEQQPMNQGFWYNRAACLVENKDYDRAHEQLDTIIGKWNKYAAPYLMKANVYLQQKDTVSAEEWVVRSLDIDRYNPEAWRMRAYFALHYQRWEQADSCLTEALRMKPKMVECYINRALARLKKNNLRGAMSDYDTALEISPNSFMAHYNRGLLRSQVGDDNRAIEDFDYVLSLEPGNIMALFNRGVLLDRTGDYKGAIRDYSKVIDKFPNFWTGLQYRAKCYRQLGQTAKAEKDEFRILKAQMDKHLGVQNRWSSSKLNAMRKLSDIDPEKYNQIVVEDEIENAHEYSSSYRGKIQNREVTAQYQPYLAMTLSNKREATTKYTPFDKDVDVFCQHLHKVCGDNSITMPIVGGVGENVGVSTLSDIDELNAIIENTKDSKVVASLKMVRAVAFSTQQNYADAIKDIDDYQKENPESMVAMWQRAVCNAMIAEHEQGTNPKESAMRNAGVISDFEKCITKNPDNAYLMYCLGTYYARINDNEKAIDYLTKAIELDNQMPQAYYNRGLALLHSGEPEKARSDLSMAGERGLYSAYSIMKQKNGRK